MDDEYGLNRYRNDSVFTQSPEQLTLMLYEAALKNVQECRMELTTNPVEGLTKSQLSRDILSALADNVNMTHAFGGTMRSLYLFCWQTIISATTKNQPSELDAVEDVLKNLIQGLSAYRGKEPLGEEKRDSTTVNFAG